MYNSEEEQVEALRSWWEKNGRSLIISVVIALAVVIGWRQWTGSRTANAEAASTVYEQMMSALGSGNEPGQLAEAEQHANTLLEEFPRSAYAGHAGLTLARVAVTQGDYEKAQAALNDVISAGHNDSLVYTARVRLARVLVQAGDTDGALKQLDGKFPEAWVGQAAEVRGDALRLAGRADDARSAYDSAIENLPAGDSARERVRMKLEDIAPAS